AMRVLVYPQITQIIVPRFVTGALAPSRSGARLRARAARRVWLPVAGPKRNTQSRHCSLLLRCLAAVVPGPPETQPVLADNFSLRRPTRPPQRAACNQTG